jgi:hypothetical protein
MSFAWNLILYSRTCFRCRAHSSSFTQLLMRCWQCWTLYLLQQFNLNGCLWAQVVVLCELNVVWRNNLASETFNKSRSHLNIFKIFRPNTFFHLSIMYMSFNVTDILLAVELFQTCKAVNHNRHKCKVVGLKIKCVGMAWHAVPCWSLWACTMIWGRCCYFCLCTFQCRNDR